MLASGLLLFAFSELGFQLGRARGISKDGHDPSFILEGAAFTLLALLLGFSFSMALGRYDARRSTLMREANAIATTFFRAELLDDKTAAEVRENLRAYVADRIAFARADAQPQQRAIADAESLQVQRTLWELADRSAQKDPHSTLVPLFLTSLNDTINLSTEQRAVLSNHIPDVVIVWLLLIALIAAGMLGYGFGREGKRALVFKAFFALMVALVFGLVLDLDRPQRGIIRVNLAPLESVAQMMDRR
jgi:hypothetical protein